MSDPYRSDEAASLTRETLLILEKYELGIKILTKGGLRSTRNFDILARNRWKYGATVIFANDDFRKEWESNAASIEERLEDIRQAHRLGISTWVSVESVVDPSQTLIVMYLLKGSVDL